MQFNHDRPRNERNFSLTRQFTLAESRIEELAASGSEGWLDQDDPLTDEQKKLLEARLEELTGRTKVERFDIR
jgi:hypothetical protein